MLFKDPTNENLAYALLDQKVAGTFHNKSYCYVSVARDTGKAWGAGIAVEWEHGYHLIDGPAVQWDRRHDAVWFCQGMNRHLGLHDQRVAEIVSSSMKKLLPI